MTHDRRLEYRLLADLLIHRLELPADQQIQSVQGIIRELSASGCRIEAPVELLVDQELQLSFHLTEEHRMEHVRGRVVRRLSQRSHKVVALEFIDLTEQQQYRIREYIVWQESQRMKP
jgi:hypothetical protein